MTYDFRSKTANNSTRLEITVEGDGAKAILHILKCLKYMGDVGASRELWVDKYHKLTGWDGDGADRIKSIMMDGQDVSEVTPEERVDFERVTS